MDKSLAQTCSKASAAASVECPEIIASTAIASQITYRCRSAKDVADIAEMLWQARKDAQGLLQAIEVALAEAEALKSHHQVTE